jgi:acyl-CoA synthetase (NDP forming)
VIQGLPSFATVSAVPGPVDLAIVAVPAPAVLAALEDCAAKGVGGCRGAQFGLRRGRRSGGRVAARHQRARAPHRHARGRPQLHGRDQCEAPHPGHLHAQRRGLRAGAGRISLVSQSGAFGGYCLSLIRQRGLGLNLWVTTGNQCDVDFADCVSHFAQDEGTQVIVGYIEAATDKARLIAALELARDNGKRIVVMKVGSSEAGAQAAASHTASLAGSDQVYDGLFRQYGVYRARSIDELFDIAYACSLSTPTPQGRGSGC